MWINCTHNADLVAVKFGKFKFFRSGQKSARMYIIMHKKTWIFTNFLSCARAICFMDSTWYVGEITQMYLEAQCPTVLDELTESAAERGSS